jgi:hypothetical protein
MDETGIIITSPWYPEFHGNRVDCRLGLEIPPNKILKITLTNLTTSGNLFLMLYETYELSQCCSNQLISGSIRTACSQFVASYYRLVTGFGG